MADANREAMPPPDGNKQNSTTQKKSKKQIDASAVARAPGMTRFQLLQQAEDNMKAALEDAENAREKRRANANVKRERTKQEQEGVKAAASGAASASTSQGSVDGSVPPPQPPPANPPVPRGEDGQTRPDDQPPPPASPVIDASSTDAAPKKTDGSASAAPKPDEPAPASPESDADAESEEGTPAPLPIELDVAQGLMLRGEWKLPGEIDRLIKSAGRSIKSLPLKTARWDIEAEDVVKQWEEEFPAVFNDQLADPCLWPEVAMNECVVNGGQVLQVLRQANVDLRTKLSTCQDAQQQIALLNDRIDEQSKQQSSIYEQAFSSLWEAFDGDFAHFKAFMIEAFKNMDGLRIFLESMVAELRPIMASAVQILERYNKALANVSDDQSALVMQAVSTLVKKERKLAADKWGEPGMQMHVTKECQAIAKQVFDQDFTHRTAIEGRLDELEKNFGVLPPWFDKNDTWSSNVNKQVAELKAENTRLRQDMEMVLQRLYAAEDKIEVQQETINHLNRNRR